MENNKEFIKERAQKYHEKYKGHLHEDSRERFLKTTLNIINKKYREKDRQKAKEKINCPKCGVSIK